MNSKIIFDDFEKASNKIKWFCSGRLNFAEPDVLVAIIKKELKIQRSLAEILQILSILFFEKTSLYQALTTNYLQNKEQENYNQLFLFDL